MLSGTGRGNTLLWVTLAVAMGGGYWAWRMIPAYYDAWSVDAILGDASSAARAATRLEDGLRERALHDIAEATRSSVARRLGHEDPALKVAVEIAGDELRVSADYQIVIEHPGLMRSSTVAFHRTATTHID